MRDVLEGKKLKDNTYPETKTHYNVCVIFVYGLCCVPDKKHGVVGCIIQTLKTILLRDPEEELMPPPGRVRIVVRITENPSTKIVVGGGKKFNLYDNKMSANSDLHYKQVPSVFRSAAAGTPWLQK